MMGSSSSFRNRLPFGFYGKFVLRLGDQLVACFSGQFGGPLRRHTRWSVQNLPQHPHVDDHLLLTRFFQWPQAAVDLGRELSSPIAPEPADAEGVCGS
jgi:hypothetical protein